MFQDASTQTEPPKDASTQTDSRPGSPQPASGPESPPMSRAASPSQMDPCPSEDEWPPMFPCPPELRPGSPQSTSDSDAAPVSRATTSPEPLIEGHQWDPWPSDYEFSPIEGHQMVPCPPEVSRAASPEPLIEGHQMDPCSS